MPENPTRLLSLTPHLPLLRTSGGDGCDAARHVAHIQTTLPPIA